MFPVVRDSERIIEEWTKELSIHINCSINDVRDNFEPSLFQSNGIRIILMDESVLEFQWAFYMISERYKAIGVFTEHCGHHVFPYHGAKIYQDSMLVYQQEND